MIKEVLLSINLSYSYYLVYVTTPNGTPVKVDEYDYTDSDLNIEDLINKGDNISKYNIRLADPTKKFNCHSYAWFNQNIENNKYKIEDPHAYFQDGSYKEIPFEKVQPRDRIVYYDKNNKILHSGIVLNASLENPNNICGSSNMYYIQSKWGDWGLYQHRGDRCPYVKPYEKNSKYVKYYRYNLPHNHKISYEAINEKYHYSICECGTLILKHNFIKGQLNNNDNDPLYVPIYECIICGYSTKFPIY